MIVIRNFKFVIALTVLAAIFLILCPSVFAQCAMCKATTSGLDNSTTRNLNIAVLMLLSPPVTIFCAFFYVAYKHRNPRDKDLD